MANKVDVFTEELSKVFTILQQQYVMIKYMKALITSGEIDETEINKLKEQITLMNTNIDNIENALASHTTEIDNNIDTINALNKVMPTDINTDSNGTLILEHDGVEITGQKKQVVIPIYEKDEQNYFYAVDTCRYEDCYIDRLFIGNPNVTYIRIGIDGIVFPERFIIKHSEQMGGLAFTDITDSSTAYLVTNTNKDYILTDHNVKTINGESIYGSGDITISGGGKQLFRHRISIINTSEKGFIFEYICDNKLKADTPSALKTITNASIGTIILCSILNLGMVVSLNTEGNGIIFDGTNWNYGYVFDGNIANSKPLTFQSIDDIVTPI